MSTTD